MVRMRKFQVLWIDDRCARPVSAMHLLEQRDVDFGEARDGLSAAGGIDEENFDVTIGEE